MSQPADDPGFNINELPEWAREVLRSEKPSTSSSGAEVTKLAGGASWPTLVSAATVSSFLPRDIVTDTDLDDAHRRAAEQSVLGLAEEVHGPDSKWALTQEARRSVLSAASHEEIADALIRTRTGSHFDDPVSIALREQLSATPIRWNRPRCRCSRRNASRRLG